MSKRAKAVASTVIHIARKSIAYIGWEPIAFVLLAAIACVMMLL